MFDSSVLYHLYNLSISRKNKALCVEKPIIYETCNPQVRIAKPLHNQTNWNVQKKVRHSLVRFAGLVLAGIIFVLAQISYKILDRIRGNVSSIIQSSIPLLFCFVSCCFLKQNERRKRATEPPSLYHEWGFYSHSIVVASQF